MNPPPGISGASQSGQDRVECTEALLANFVEDCPVGIYLVQDGLIRFGNRWLREFSGYSLEDLPISALDVIVPGDRPFVAEQMTRRVRGEEALPEYQVGFLKKNGETVPVKLVATVVTFRGRPAIQGSIIDLSPQVAIQEALRDHARRLEESVRFRQLVNEVLSHDLVNRLWIAERYASLIPSGSLTSEESDFLERIRSSLGKALDLIKDMKVCLELSDPDSILFSEVDLAAFIRQSAQELRPLLRERRIRLLLPRRRRAVVFASPLLHHVIDNLLSNAAKYGPEGGQIAVAVTGRDPVRITVSDNGPGVAPGDRELVFERFRRLDRSSIKGIGLGLAIVRRLVEIHNGSVRVEENPGGGSIFLVEIPRVQPDRHPPPNDPLRDLEARGGAGGGRPEC